MYSDNGGGVDCILAVFLDGQSISISHTLTRGGGVVCTLAHPSAILAGTVRVSWELCPGMEQHIF